MLPLVIWTVALLAAAFWIFQFTQLMVLSDYDFPGRYDKALWVAAFIFANVLAAAAFWFWKQLMQSVRQEQQRGGGTRGGKPDG